MLIDFTNIQPDEVSIEDYARWKNSTFHICYKQAEQCLKQIILRGGEQPGAADQPFKVFSNHSNLLAFVGNRGSGKTSAMMSFVKACVEGKLTILDADGQKCIFYMLPAIEPSRLSEKETIVASVVSQIYSELEDRLQNSAGRAVDQALITRIANQCTNVREAIRVQGMSPQDLLQESCDELSHLRLLAQTKRLWESLRQLIDSYLQFCGQGVGGHPVLILPVDDIDTSIPNAHRITEELQNHLTLPNVVIMLALKPEQLSDALGQQFISEFRDLYQNQRMLDVQPAEMAAKYLEKFIPSQRRIELPNLELPSAGSCVVKWEDRPCCPLKELFSSLVWEKTGILLVGDSEDGHPLIPRNLRTLHQTFLFLQSMKSVSALKGAEGRSTLLRQLEQLNAWLLNSLSGLAVPLCEILRGFSIHTDERLAAFLWRSLVEFLTGRNCAPEVKNLLMREIQSENISMGDVLYLLTLLQQTDAENCFASFGAAVRLLYSIRLRREMVFALSEELNEETSITKALQEMPEVGYQQVFKIWNGLVYDPTEPVTYDGLERMCNGDAVGGQVAVPTGEAGAYEIRSLYGGVLLSAAQKETIPGECMTIAEAVWISLFTVGFGRVRRQDIHTLQGSMLRGILRPAERHVTTRADLEIIEPAYVNSNWLAFFHQLLLPEDAARRLLWQVKPQGEEWDTALGELKKQRWAVLFDCLHMDSVDFVNAVVRHLVEHTVSIYQEAEDPLAAMNGFFYVKTGLEKAVTAVGKRAGIAVDLKPLQEFLGKLPNETDENRYAKYGWLCQH